MAALFEKFLETCTLFMTPNSTKLTNLLRKRYQCADENYRNSAEFTDLLTEATQKIQAGDGQIFVHIQTVNHELKAYARTNRVINVAKKKSSHSETKVKRCILSSFEPIQQCSVLSALNLVPVNHSANTGHSSAINMGAHAKFSDDNTLFDFNTDDELPTISPPSRRTTLKSSRADDFKKSKLSLSKRRREDEGKKSPKRSPRREDEGKRSPRSRSPRSPRSQSPRSKYLRVDHRTDEFLICSLGKKTGFDTDGISYENDFVSISFNENSDSEKSNESTKTFAQGASTEDIVRLKCSPDTCVNSNENTILPKSEPSLVSGATATTSAIDENKFTNILPIFDCDTYISPIKLEFSDDISQRETQSVDINVDESEDNLTSNDTCSRIAIKVETDYNLWDEKSVMTLEDKDIDSHVEAEKEDIIPQPPKKIKRISTLSSVNRSSTSNGSKVRHIGSHADRKDEDSGRESPETAAPDQDVSPKAKAGSQRQIKQLERLLTNIDRKIHKVKEKELSLDDLEDEDSAYILEDKLEKKFMKVWNRLCELKGRDKSTGRVTEKKFVYQGTRYPEINLKISKFVNKKKTFPNFRNVHAIISFVNEKKSLRLRAQTINDLARESFQDVGNLLQNRRKQDYAADFGCHITDPISAGDPAIQDRELRKKLEENHKVGVYRLDQVISKYVEKQMTTGEVPQEFSHSDSDDNNVDVIIDDDDDDDDVATLHDSDTEQCRASTPVTEDIKPLVIEVDTPSKDDILASSGGRSVTPDGVGLKDPVPIQYSQVDTTSESNLESSILILEPDCVPMTTDPGIEVEPACGPKAVNPVIKVKNNDYENEQVEFIDTSEQSYAIETENSYVAFNPNMQVEYNNGTNDPVQPVLPSLVNSQCPEPTENSNENCIMCLKIESVWSVVDVERNNDYEMPVDLLSPSECEPEPQINDDNDVICVDIELVPGSSQEIIDEYENDAIMDNNEVVCVDEELLPDTPQEMAVSNDGHVLDTDQTINDAMPSASNGDLELDNNDENDVVCIDEEILSENSSQELTANNECSNSVSLSHRNEAVTPQFNYDPEPDTNDENELLPDSSQDQVNDATDSLCIDISEQGDINHVANEGYFVSESVTQNKDENDESVDPEFRLVSSDNMLENDEFVDLDGNDDNQIAAVDVSTDLINGTNNDDEVVDIFENDDIVNLDGNEADFDSESINENNDEYNERVDPELPQVSSNEMLENDEVVNLDENEAHFKSQSSVAENNAENNECDDKELRLNSCHDMLENDEFVKLNGNYDDQIASVHAPTDLIDRTANDDEVVDIFENDDVVNLDENEAYFDSESIAENKDENIECVDPDLSVDSTHDKFEVVKLDRNDDNHVPAVDDVMDGMSNDDEVVDLDSLPGSTQDIDEHNDCANLESDRDLDTANDAVYTDIHDTEDDSNHQLPDGVSDNNDHNDEILGEEVFVDSSRDLFENDDYVNLETSAGADMNDHYQMSVGCVSMLVECTPEADSNDDDDDEVILVDQESVTEPDEDMDVKDSRYNDFTEIATDSKHVSNDDEVHSVSSTDINKDDQELHRIPSPEPDVDSNRNNEYKVSSADVDDSVDKNADNEVVCVDQESDSEPEQDHDDVNDNGLCNGMLEPREDNPVSENMLVESESAMDNNDTNADICPDQEVIGLSQDKLEDDECVKIDSVTEPDQERVNDSSCIHFSESDDGIQVGQDLCVDSELITNDDGISALLTKSDPLIDKDDIFCLDTEMDAVETGDEGPNKNLLSNTDVTSLEMEIIDSSSQDKLEDDECVNLDSGKAPGQEERVNDSSCIHISESDDGIQVEKDLCADSELPMSSNNNGAMISTLFTNPDPLIDKDDIFCLGTETDAMETGDKGPNKELMSNTDVASLEMECVDESEDVFSDMDVSDPDDDEHSNSSTKDSNHDDEQVQVDTDTDNPNYTEQDTAVVLRNDKVCTSVDTPSVRRNKTKTDNGTTNESATKLVSLMNAHLTANVRKLMQKRLQVAIVNSFQKQQVDNSECCIVSISPVTDIESVSSASISPVTDNESVSSMDVIEIDCASPSSGESPPASASSEDCSADNNNQKHVLTTQSSCSNDDIIVISVKKNNNLAPRSSYKSSTNKVVSTPRSIIKRKTTSTATPFRHSGNSVSPIKRVRFSPILKIRTNIVGNVPLLRGRDRNGAILERHLIQNPKSYSNSRLPLNDISTRTSPSQDATVPLPRRTVISPFWPGNNSNLASYRTSMQASARSVFDKYLKSKTAASSSVQVNPIGVNVSPSNSSASRRQPLPSASIPMTYSNNRTRPQHASPLITRVAGATAIPNIAHFRTLPSPSRLRTFGPFTVREQSWANAVTSNIVNRTQGVIGGRIPNVARNSSISLSLRKNTRTISPSLKTVPLSSRKSSDIIILD